MKMGVMKTIKATNDFLAITKFVYCGECDDRILGMKGTRPEPSELACLHLAPKPGNALDQGQSNVPPAVLDYPATSSENDPADGSSAPPGAVEPGEGEGIPNSLSTPKPGTKDYKPPSDIKKPGEQLEGTHSMKHLMR